MKLRDVVGGLILGSGLVAAGPACGAPAPETKERPLAFDVQASAITVDVVVLAKDGRPVRGLTREDFTVLEDGRPQRLVGFEDRHTTEGAAEVEQAAQGERASGVSNGDGLQPPERVFALLIDDLGLTPLVAGPLQ